MRLISACKHVAKVILKRETVSFSPVCKTEEEKHENIFYEDLDETKLVSKNDRQFKHLVSIDGVGFSGSSAVGDFLGEFQNVTSLGGVDPRENPDRGIENSYEIDFLRDPGSIVDLERICYTNIGRVRDNAVHEFIEVCKYYHNGAIPFFDDYFYELSKKFVKELTAYAFNDSPSHVSYYPKRLSVAEFRSLARDFMLSILKNIPSNDYLVCDNLTSVGRPDNGIIDGYLDYGGGI